MDRPERLSIFFQKYFAQELLFVDLQTLSERRLRTAKAGSLTYNNRLLSSAGRATDL